MAQPNQSIDFVSLDVETANRFRGSICEIGLVRFNEKGVVATYQTLVKPWEEFGDFYFSFIHGITAADVAGSPTIDEIWSDIWEFIGESPLIAHNASFDMGALFDVSGVIGLPIPPTTYWCTLVAARKLLLRPSHKLIDLAEYLEIPQYSAHRAADDARVAGELALKLLNIAEISSLEEFQTQYEIAPGYIDSNTNIGCKKITEFSDHTTSLKRYPPPPTEAELRIIAEEQYAASLHLPIARDLLLQWMNSLPDGLINLEGVFHGREVYFHDTDACFSAWDGQQAVALEGGFSATKITKFTTMIVCTDSDRDKFAGNGCETISPSDFLKLLPRGIPKLSEFRKPSRY